MEHYDAIVIGSGQAGTPLSIALGRGWTKNRLGRESACRRHLYQCGLHTDEDHGGQRANCLPGPARRRLRRSVRAGGS